MVDDEADVLELLKYNLEREGFQVTTALNGKDAIKTAKVDKPDLIVLDIMMPGMDGIEVCERMRAMPEFNNTIIVFLTARSESFTQITALETGGDDYIQKPIKPNVFKSRIKAILRRHPSLSLDAQPSTSSKFGPLEINFEKFLVFVNGDEVQLARKEFELLALLASKPGKVFKRIEILSKVWGEEVIVGDRTIDVHIRKLREKIGGEFIGTLKGVGYKLDY